LDSQQASFARRPEELDEQEEEMEFKKYDEKQGLAQWIYNISD